MEKKEKKITPEIENIIDKLKDSITKETFDVLNIQHYNKFCEDNNISRNLKNKAWKVIHPLWMNDELFK